jgi:hypothetical protein
MTRQRFKRHAVKASGSEDRAARPVPAGVAFSARRQPLSAVHPAQIATATPAVCIQHGGSPFFAPPPGILERCPGGQVDVPPN